MTRVPLIPSLDTAQCAWLRFVKIMIFLSFRASVNPYSKGSELVREVLLSLFCIVKTVVVVFVFVACGSFFFLNAIRVSVIWVYCRIFFRVCFCVYKVSVPSRKLISSSAVFIIRISSLFTAYSDDFNRQIDFFFILNFAIPRESYFTVNLLRIIVREFWSRFAMIFVFNPDQISHQNWNGNQSGRVENASRVVFPARPLHVRPKSYTLLLFFTKSQFWNWKPVLIPVWVPGPSQSTLQWIFPLLCPHFLPPRSRTLLLTHLLTANPNYFNKTTG